MNMHFFLTGGTGLVGLNLIPRLMRSLPDSTMTLLVRGKNDSDVDHRIRSIVDRLITDEKIPEVRNRIRGVRGDVSAQNLGLDFRQSEEIIASTTHIIHGAATIRFDHPIEEARMINCGGTRSILSLAQQCTDRGRLERFMYVGSSSVSGQRAGSIFEHELEMGQTFFNTYEQSKCESERIVRNHFHQIPSIIVRPSIIIGDSRTGHTTSFNVIYIPLRLLQRGLLKFIPGTPDTTLDLVPIDWVADAMVYLLCHSDSTGKAFHLTAGPARAARLGEVVHSASEYFETHTPLSQPRHVEFVDRQEFDRRRALVRGREEALMTQLDTLLPYVSIDRLFDSGNTDSLLSSSSIRFPLFPEYSDAIFSFCLKTNWGKHPM